MVCAIPLFQLSRHVTPITTRVTTVTHQWNCTTPIETGVNKWGEWGCPPSGTKTEVNEVEGVPHL